MSNYSNIIKNREIAVWGMGYLAYTFMLKLQEKGFSIRLFDLSEQSLSEYHKGRYPSKTQINTWSKTSQVPQLDFSKVKIVASSKEMFSEDILIHIICTPASYLKGNYNENIIELSHIFKENCNSLARSYVIFQSVSGPGSIERDFCQNIDGIEDRLGVCTSFRSDWTYEEFAVQSYSQIISSTRTEDLEFLVDFYNLLDLPIEKVASIYQAELLENARNSLEFTIHGFMNQLMQAYPDTDVRQIKDLILQRCRIEDYTPGLGSGGFRMPSAMNQLVRESKHENQLSLIHESGVANLSNILLYVDHLVRLKTRKVLILGVRVQQELALSPSLIMANSLIDKEIEVSLHDPFYSKVEIKRFNKQFFYFDFENSSLEGFDAIVITSDHPNYAMLKDEHIRDLAKYPEVLILDSYGIWTPYFEREHKNYHLLGSGSLDLLK
ncbi:UDP-glucose/GDP-mannose dehydrogenase family protein [bacterium]|nr:UDP-glucose/GDP-mannose dehydrogenase family protein [bacterium]